MFYRPVVAVSLAVSVAFSTPAAATPAQAEILFDTLGLPDIIDIMREEGITYGAQIGTDMFPDQATSAWAATVETIYDPDAMQNGVKSAFVAALDGQNVTPMIDFFTSEPGRTLVALEVSARRALLDDAVDSASKDVAAIARDDNTTRFQLVEKFVKTNDLIETNVVGGMNSNVAFYTGLMAGGAFDGVLTQDQILADVWDQEADIRDSTSQWVYGFLMLAYDPVSDADLQTYTAFSGSPVGAALNVALFDAFDGMFDTISFALGREAARVMAGKDL